MKAALFSLDEAIIAGKTGKEEYPYDL